MYISEKGGGMAQVAFSVRMDSDLKKKFEDLCESLGMNMTTAFNIFARTVVREQGIPFEISAVKSKTNSISYAPTVAAMNMAADKQAVYSAKPRVMEDSAESLAALFEQADKLRLSTRGKSWTREELHER